MYLNFTGESMKKVLWVALVFLFVNVHAGDELVRKFLEVKKSENFVPLPIKFYKGNVEFKYLIVGENFIIITPSQPSKSEKAFFTTMTIGIKWFLKNYMVGKIPQKMIIFGLDGDSRKYPMFEISKNNLRLLDNRDFGAKDILAFNDNGGLVYPLKLILRRGNFTDRGRKLANVKKRYSKFLETFDISPLIEGMVESWYEKKKTK